MNTNEIRDKILSRYTAERELQQDGGQVPIVEAPQSSGANPWGLLSASTNNIGSILQKEDQRNQAMFNIQGARQDQKNADIAAREELLLKHQNALELAAANRAPMGLNAIQQDELDQKVKSRERTEQHALLAQRLAESDVDLDDHGGVNAWLAKQGVAPQYSTDILSNATGKLTAAVGGQVAPSVERYVTELDRTYGQIQATADASVQTWMRENNMDEQSLRGEELSFTGDGISKATNDYLKEKGVEQDYSDAKGIVEYMKSQMGGKIDIKLLGRVLDEAEDTGLFGGTVDDILEGRGKVAVDALIAEAGYGKSERAEEVRALQKRYKVFQTSLGRTTQEASKKYEKLKADAVKRNLMAGGRRELRQEPTDMPLYSEMDISRAANELSQYIPNMDAANMAFDGASQTQPKSASVMPKAEAEKNPPSPYSSPDSIFAGITFDSSLPQGPSSTPNKLGLSGETKNAFLAKKAEYGAKNSGKLEGWSDKKEAEKILRKAEKAAEEKSKQEEVERQLRFKEMRERFKERQERYAAALSQ